MKYPSELGPKVSFFEWDRDSKRQNFKAMASIYGTENTQSCIGVKQQLLS